MTEAVHATIDSYLALLDAALREQHEREREELLAEVRVHLEEAAAGANDAQAAVEKAVRSLGDPRELAARLRERDGGTEEPARERVQRILGMPYNFSRLSTEQVAARIWNTSDPRIFMPRVFGIGWTINFGAVAVRLGLVRPDDEEPVPFASVPDGALWGGLALVTVVNLAAVAAAFLLRDPAGGVPVHFGFAGPDRFSTPLVAALSFLGPATALNAVALWRFVRGASRTERALWVFMLTFTILVFDGMHANALFWAHTGRLLVFAGAPVLAGMVAGFAVLVVYSRLGVRAEWRRARIR